MKKTPTPSGVELAIRKAGTQVLLAEALNVTQQAVSLWATQGWMPIERARQVARLYRIPAKSLINPKFRVA
jgi:hypothetical protein